MTVTGEDCRGPLSTSPDPLGASIDQEFSVILSAAKELAANSAVVLLLGGGRLEVIHRWSKCGPVAVSSPVPLTGGPELHQVLAGHGGPVCPGSPLARVLRAAAGSAANSFVLFTRQLQKSVVAIAFGFAAEPPPYSSVPQAAAERLNLAAYAMWSSRQLDRLHTELHVVNQRLAGRKLVERAKALLQAELQLDERQAYEHLRKKSRQRRITIAKLAEELLRRSAAELGPQSPPD
jgi:AmiR/NasT family two-component response regulator